MNHRLFINHILRKHFADHPHIPLAEMELVNLFPDETEQKEEDTFYCMDCGKAYYNCVCGHDNDEE